MTNSNADTSGSLAAVPPPGLITAIREGNCVAFVGAGFVAPVMRDWDGLLGALAEQAPVDVRNDVQELLRSFKKDSSRGVFDREAAAQMLEEKIGAGFASKLQHALYKPESGQQERLERRKRTLAEIPFQAVLTTNFDANLKGELRSPEAYRAILRGGGSLWYDMVNWESDAENVELKRPTILLHGSVGEPPDDALMHDEASVIFTRAGYRKLLFGNPAYSNFLRSMFATRTVLFLGFSFSDAYLNLLRSEVLSFIGADQEKPVAYAIMDNLSVPEANFLRTHEGIEVLNYKAGESHQGFDDYLEAIKDATSKQKRISDLVNNKTILWVDSEPHNNAHGFKMLGGHSNIELFDSPAAALQRLSDGRKVDLVISHWGHGLSSGGGPNGEYLLRSIRSRGTQCPVVIFAAPDRPNEPPYANANRKIALNLGAYEYTWGWSALFGSIERLFSPGEEARARPLC